MSRYVDTNILVRLMTNDVPELAQAAAVQVKQSRRAELVILDGVLVELFFVLEVHPLYRFSRDRVVALFEAVLALPQFKISESATAAFSLFASHKKLDFVACLLAVSSDGQSERVVTFDKDLQRILA